MRRVAFVLVLLLISGPTLADARQDCDHLSIDACTELIRQNPEDAAAYLHRADPHLSKDEYGQAHADYIKARELIRFDDTLLFDTDKFSGYSRKSREPASKR
jgi:hypothetical protein